LDNLILKTEWWNFNPS